MYFGRKSKYRAYRSWAHLASSISILGPPHPELTSRGEYSSKFFSQCEYLTFPSICGYVRCTGLTSSVTEQGSSRPEYTCRQLALQSDRDKLAGKL